MGLLHYIQRYMSVLGHREALLNSPRPNDYPVTNAEERQGARSTVLRRLISWHGGGVVGKGESVLIENNGVAHGPFSYLG